MFVSFHTEMRHMMNRMLITLFISFSSWLALAQEVREFYTSSRYLAMGGAAAAIANDETALLANPAGLGKLRDSYGTIFDPELETNQNSYTIYTSSAVSDPFTLEKVKGALDNNRNTFYHSKFQLFPSFVVRNFGIGIFARKSLDAYEDETGTNITANYYDDMAIVMGFNFRFFDGRVKLGFNGKFISRISIEDKVIPTTEPMDLKSQAKEGAAIGSDVGLVLAAPWTYIPTVAVVLHDAGGTTFNAGSGLRLSVADRPTKIDQDYDVAFALFPIHTNRTRSTFTFEYQKVQASAKDEDKTKFYHLGYELNISDLLFLRAGMNGRYWTGGLELASEKTQIQLTSYGEEIGTSLSRVEDRRYVMKFAFRF
jgi:hypothetical protein